ncbi:hypothetical protein TRIUR3_13536 [Triticum urartu]|uniref:Uncharacterized protein n=1 Tax=Triticum urartu TaxID=4572 RepID=M7YRF8_TRIUA|nr:hypothetical protein TRIUR3_13536 [Triticum urartu]
MVLQTFFAASGFHDSDEATDRMPNATLYDNYCRKVLTRMCEASNEVQAVCLWRDEGGRDEPWRLLSEWAWLAARCSILRGACSAAGRTRSKCRTQLKGQQCAHIGYICCGLYAIFGRRRRGAAMAERGKKNRDGEQGCDASNLPAEMPLCLIGI